MIKREDLSNQVKFFKYLDAGVRAYKLFDEGSVDSYYDGVKRSKNAPPISGIAGSNVLLAKTILGIALARRTLVAQLRENGKNLLFSKIENEEDFIRIKNRIFTEDPTLSNAECDKILTSICNSIAHGDITKSFNFDVFEKGIKEIYRECGTIESKKKPELRQKLNDTIRNSASIYVNYTSRFTFDNDGNKIPRPTPVKYNLNIDFATISALLTRIVFNNDLSQNSRIAYGLTEDGVVHIADENLNELESFPLNNIQKKNFVEIYEHCTEMFKSHNYHGMNIAKLLQYYENLDSCRKTGFVDQSKMTLAEQYAMDVALQSVLFEDKFSYIKTRNMSTIAITLPPDIEASKQDIKEHTIRITDLDMNLFGHNMFFLSVGLYQTLNLERIYKEMLITETLTMLELAEQNCLLTRIAENKNSEEFFDAVGNDTDEEYTSREKVKILNHLRNSLVHANYIIDAEDKYYLFDQISRSNETLECKYVITIDELEAVKNACIDVFTTLEKEMIADEELQRQQAIEKEKEIAKLKEQAKTNKEPKTEKEKDM